MATFSTNQNRQFYLAKRYADGSTVPAVGSDTSAVGDLGVSVKDGELYFTYQGADTVLRSDRIPLKNLDYVKAVKASAMATKMRKVEIALDSTINSGAPISGQDYLLRIAFRQFYGMSDEDQYIKDCAVHATASMSASDFYKAMVKALNNAFSREVGATKDSNPYLSFSVDNNSTATKIIIEEKPQDWTLGVQAQERVYFDVIPTTIWNGGDEVIWAAQDDTTGNYYTEATPTTTVGNGKKIADLEWFCMGERGDQYRLKGYPNYIPTTYLVDPTLEYNVLELHFSFTDAGVHSYKSEKDITIAVPNGAAGHVYDVINAIIGAINSAASTSIATLS